MISKNSILSILQSSIENRSTTRVSGLTPSASTLLSARYAQKIRTDHRKQIPIVVICPNDEVSAEFSSDLFCLNSTLKATPFQISLFPTWEQSAYTSVHLSQKTRIERLSALHRLVHENKNEGTDTHGD